MHVHVSSESSVINTYLICLEYYAQKPFTWVLLVVFTQRLKWTRWSAGTLLHMLLSVLRWGGVSSSATIKLCADLRGKGFHFVCVCTSQAYFKNTITNSRDTISNDCQCVFLPETLVAVWIEQMPQRSLQITWLQSARSLGRLTREPRASRGGLQGASAFIVVIKWWQKPRWYAKDTIRQRPKGRMGKVMS